MGHTNMTIQRKTSVARLGLLESIKKYRNYNAGSEFFNTRTTGLCFC